MRSYFTLFSLSIILSFLITPIIRRKALIWGAVAVPDTGRHIHRQPTPRLGGVAIFISFILALLLVPYLLWVGFASALTWTIWRSNPGLL